ncbi:MAG: DeoR/GlpR family DNA-binding transcription regulator [Anaerolineales bacterium]
MKIVRQQLIVEEVKSNRQATVAELSARFNVSEVTIRRDLRELADEGILQRTHGGALSIPRSVPEMPVVHRMKKEGQYKEKIGQAAEALISNGESVFIGSGSTTAYLARQLMHRKGLTVVTNALTIATELASAKDITIVITGGMMRPSELSLVGHITEQALREVRVDKIIMGVPAISLEDGLTNDYLPEVMTDRTIIEMAQELILVADHTKFGKVGSAYVAPISRVTTLVTDSQTDPDILKRIEELGIQIIVADQKIKGES